jgi:hypothetical protein
MKTLFGYGIVRLLLFAVTAELYAVPPACAQAVQYAYDASGNRTVRSRVIVMPATRAAVDTAGKAQAEKTASDVAAPYGETLAGMKISIYPNPTKGVLRIDIDGDGAPADAKVTLYSVSGNPVRQWTGVSGYGTVDVSEQPAGTYIMHITFGADRVSVWKIVKE